MRCDPGPCGIIGCMPPQPARWTAHHASSWLRLTVLGPLLAGALAVACGESPPAFREVSLEDARRLIASGEVTVVDRLADESTPVPGLPGGLRWQEEPGGSSLPPGLPDGAVLIVGASTDLGYASAAALARAGRRPVYLFITRTTRERNALVAVVLHSREVSDGRDS